MDESDRIMIKDAVASMDLGQKILLYESMKKNVG